jgi:hypothetical protein
VKLQRIFAILAVALLFATGTARAQKPASGDVALFVNNISALPMYNLGYFMSEDVMGYGSLAFSNNDNDSGVAFGLGARIYGAPGSSQNIRTYWNADLQHTTDGYVNGNSGLASFGGLGGLGNDVTTLSADFGAEAELAPQFTLGVQVGLQVLSTEDSTGSSFTQINLGTADLALNYYF